MEEIIEVNGIRVYKNRFCKCGCGRNILFNDFQIYKGIPNYIQGHNNNHRKKEINEEIIEVNGIRVYKNIFCKCGCGQNIIVKEKHKWSGIAKYINGHQCIGKSKYPELDLTIEKFCKCGCGQKIEIKSYRKYRNNTTPDYIYGHNRKHKKMSEEHKRKIGKANKGNTISYEQKQYLSKINKGKKMSLENKEKLIFANTGRKFSKETRQKLSKSIINSILKNDGINKGAFRGKKGKFFSIKNNKTLYYDSTYELQAFKILEQMSIVKLYYRCDIYIKYEYKNNTRRYIPDVIVEYTNGEKDIIEIKPENRINEDINKAKFNAAKLFCDKKGLNFKVWTEKELFIDSKMENNKLCQ